MSNGKELKVKYHGNKEKPTRKKNPNVASVSKLGYRDDSPYRSLPYIDIHTPDGSIDMSGTGIPLWANGRILPPYSGIHQFDTQTVKEIPLAQKGKGIKTAEKDATNVVVQKPDFDVNPIIGLSTDPNVVKYLQTQKDPVWAEPYEFLTQWYNAPATKKRLVDQKAPIDVMTEALNQKRFNNIIDWLFYKQDQYKKLAQDIWGDDIESVFNLQDALNKRLDSRFEDLNNTTYGFQMPNDSTVTITRDYRDPVLNQQTAVHELTHATPLDDFYVDYFKKFKPKNPESPETKKYLEENPDEIYPRIQDLRYQLWRDKKLAPGMKVTPDMLENYYNDGYDLTKYYSLEELARIMNEVAYVPQDDSQLPMAQDGTEVDSDYNMARAKQLGYTPNEAGHWPSVDYKTGEWLKSKEHPSAWMEYLYGYTLNPQQALNYDVRTNPQGYFGDNTLQYVPKQKTGGSTNWLEKYQTKGEKKLPGKFKKKMQDPTYGYGVQWFNDWYTHPETQKRLEQSGLDQEDMRYAFENIGNTQFAQTYPEVMSIIRRDLNKTYENPKRVNKFLGPIGEEILSAMPDVKGFALPADESFGLVYAEPQSLRKKDSVFPHELIHASTIDRDIANQIGANKAYITPKLKEFYPDLYKEAKKSGNKELINQMFENVGAPDEQSMFREIYPYVQSLRYELGVKPGETITEGILNKADQNKSLGKLLKMYSKPKLIQFMNTVAENKQPGMDMPMAKRGGLPKAQTGIPKKEVKFQGPGGTFYYDSNGKMISQAYYNQLMKQYVGSEQHEKDQFQETLKNETYDEQKAREMGYSPGLSFGEMIEGSTKKMRDTVSPNSGEGYNTFVGTDAPLKDYNPTVDRLANLEGWESHKTYIPDIPRSVMAGEWEKHMYGDKRPYWATLTERSRYIPERGRLTNEYFYKLFSDQKNETISNPEVDKLISSHKGPIAEFSGDTFMGKPLFIPNPKYDPSINIDRWKVRDTRDTQIRYGIDPYTGESKSYYLPYGITPPKEYEYLIKQPGDIQHPLLKKTGGSKLPPHLPEAYMYGGFLPKAQKGIPQAAAPSRPTSQTEEQLKQLREQMGIPTKPKVSKKEIDYANERGEYFDYLKDAISTWKDIPIKDMGKAYDYGIDLKGLWDLELKRRKEEEANKPMSIEELAAISEQMYGRTLGERLGDVVYNFDTGWNPFGNGPKWRRRPLEDTPEMRDVLQRRINSASFDKDRRAESDRLSSELPWWKDLGPLNADVYSEDYSTIPGVSKNWRANLYRDTQAFGDYWLTNPAKGMQPFDWMFQLGPGLVSTPAAAITYGPTAISNFGTAPHLAQVNDSYLPYLAPALDVAVPLAFSYGPRAVKKLMGKFSAVDTPDMLPGSSNVGETFQARLSEDEREKMLKRFLGKDYKPPLEIEPPTPGQMAQVEEGLDWLKYYYSQPEIRQRWDNMFGNNANLNRQLRRLMSGDANRHVQYPTKIRGYDNLEDLPLADYDKTDLRFYTQHPLIEDLDLLDWRKISAHEGTHWLTHGDLANKYIENYIKPIFGNKGIFSKKAFENYANNPDKLFEFTGYAGQKVKMKGKDIIYLTSPEEVYARINELRYKLFNSKNIRPGQKLTERDILDALKNREAIRDDFDQLLDLMSASNKGMVLGDKSNALKALTKAMNTLPAVGGAGMLMNGMTGEGEPQLQKQRVGGPIRKFQVPPGEMPAEGPVRPVTIPMIEAGINMPEVTSAPEPTDARTSFSQAFREARNAGLKEFVWRGKRYGTKYRSEMQPAAPKVVQPAAPAPAPFDMTAAAARPASTESISTSNYGNYANMLASTWMTRNRMTALPVSNTPKTLPGKTEKAQRQVDTDESRKLGINFGKSMIPTREERMRQNAPAPVTPTALPSEFAPVTRPTSQIEMRLQQMRNQIVNQPSPEQQAAEYTAMFPPSPVSSPMPEWAMNTEMANAIKSRSAQASAPVESSIPEWAMTPEMVTAIRKRNLQTQTPVQQPMPEWATDSSLVNAVNNMKRDAFLASQAEGPAGMPMSDADKLIAQLRQNVGQQPSEQEQLAMYEQMMQAMRQSRPKVEQPAPGAPYSVVVTDPNASQTTLPIHAAEGLKYPVSGQAQQMYGFDYGDAILSGLGNAWEGVKDFGEDVVNQTMDFSKNIAEQTAEMLGQPNEERIKQIDKLSKELNKVDDSIQKLYYDATNPDSKTKKESEDKLEKVYEERKNLITQLNESKADIGFIDRNLNKLLQDNGEYAAAALKALHKGISINEKQFGIVDELSETGFELPRLETYGEKKQKEDEQHKQSNWIDDLDTSKHPFVRWKYRINASNEKPMLVTVHGTRGERDANQYLPADIQAEGTVGHFLDQNPISGYMHPNTANMFKSLAEDDYVGKLEPTDKKDVYAVKFVKRKTLPKDFAKMTKNAFVIRQDKFDDIDFDKKITDTNFGGHTYWYNKTKKNRAVPVSSGPDPNTYDYTSGGNVYFIFEYKGKTKYIPFAGSPNEIRKEGERLKKDYKLDKGKLVISMADAGSYGSSIRSDQTTKRITNTLLNDKGHGYFNRNSFTGSGMSFVGFKK